MGPAATGRESREGLFDAGSMPSLGVAAPEDHLSIVGATRKDILPWRPGQVKDGVVMPFQDGGFRHGVEVPHKDPIEEVFAAQISDEPCQVSGIRAPGQVDDRSSWRRARQYPSISSNVLHPE